MTDRERNLERIRSVVDNGRPEIEYTSLIGASTSRPGTEVVQQTGLYPADFLPYPKDYFNPLSGKNPNSAKDAELLWQYRKNRNTDGLSDRTVPDGDAMLEEIQNTRDSLRAFIVVKYTEKICDIAEEMNLTLLGKTSKPVTLADMRAVLVKMEFNQENMNLVYELVHRFHRDRSWLTSIIDSWLFTNKMYLLKQTKPKYNENNKRTRISQYDRGGFSAVGRSAKSQTVGGLMIPMLKHAGWSLSLTTGQSNDKEYKKFWYNRNEMFYLVTSKKKAEPLEEYVATMSSVRI